MSVETAKANIIAKLRKFPNKDQQIRALPVLVTRFASQEGLGNEQVSLLMKDLMTNLPGLET